MFDSAVELVLNYSSEIHKPVHPDTRMRILAIGLFVVVVVVVVERTENNLKIPLERTS